MLKSLVTALFGCSHRRTSFPITPKTTTPTYVTCLDCGVEFEYDWVAMRRAKVAVSRPKPAGTFCDQPDTKTVGQRVSRAAESS